MKKPARMLKFLAGFLLLTHEFPSILLHQRDQFGIGKIVALNAYEVFARCQLAAIEGKSVRDLSC